MIKIRLALVYCAACATSGGVFAYLSARTERWDIVFSGMFTFAEGIA